jgi:hypothetical protein
MKIQNVVVAGKVMAADVLKLAQANTVEGSSVKFTVTGSSGAPRRRQVAIHYSPCAIFDPNQDVFIYCTSNTNSKFPGVRPPNP